MFGDSYVEIHYPDQIAYKSLDEFNENEILDDNEYEKILVFINSENLISRLQEKVSKENREEIMNVIARIKLLQED